MGRGPARASKLTKQQILAEAPRHTTLLSLAQSLGLNSAQALHYRLTSTGWKEDVDRYLGTGKGMPKPYHLDDEQDDAAPAESYAEDNDIVEREPQYGYDEEHGIYTFLVNGRYRHFDADTWRYVCRAYSAEGLNMTRALICEQVNCPPEELEVCLRKYGFFKSSQPFTHEDFMEMSDDEAISETLETKRSRWRARLMKAERSDLIKRVEEAEEELYRRKQDTELLLNEAREALSGLEAAPSFPLYGKMRHSADATEWECHAPLADIHVGLLTWHKESWRGGDYDTEISAERIRTHGQRVADWIASQPGRCTVVHRTDLGDIFHSLTEATVSGTPLQVDGRPLKVWREALQGEIAAIEHLRCVSDKVEVRRVPGNHDGLQADLLSETLAAWYRNADDVEVFTTFNGHSHFISGETLHLLTHGKGIGALSHKAKASFEVIAREVAQDDYFKVRKMKMYFGHLHNPAVERQGRHMELIRLPSLAEPDDYAQSLYFVHDPEARVFRLAADGDIESERRLFF